MRVYSEGNLRKRQKRDGSWEWFGQLSFMEDGKQKRLSHFTGVACSAPTKKELEAKKNRAKRGRGEKPEGKGARQAMTEFREWRDGLIKAEEERAKADEEKPPTAKLSVIDYTDRYIERGKRVDGQELSKSSKLDYTLVSKYFMRGESPIAGTKMCELKPMDVREWEDALLAEGLSGVTVAKAHRLLHLVCQDALSMEAIDRNPCAGVKPPKREGDADKQPNALSDRDMGRAALVLSTLSQTPKIVAAQIAMYAALRQGEVCALQWRDVDLDGVKWEPERRYRMVEIKGPKLRVCQSIGRSNGGCYAKPPKTRNGYRIVPICGHLLDALRAHRRAMYEEYLLACSALGKESSEEGFSELYVVGTPDGRFYNPTVLSRQWATTSKDLGLVGSDGRAVGFHDLRRTFSTIAQNKEMPEISYKYVMGHSSGDLTTSVYTAPMSKAVQKAAEVVAKELDDGMRKARSEQ